MKQYLSIREVADQMGFTYQHIWNLIRRGELPAVRMGHALRIPVSALDRMCKEVIDDKGETTSAR